MTAPLLKNKTITTYTGLTDLLACTLLENHVLNKPVSVSVFFNNSFSSSHLPQKAKSGQKKKKDLFLHSLKMDSQREKGKAKPDLPPSLLTAPKDPPTRVGREGHSRYLYLMPSASISASVSLLSSLSMPVAVRTSAPRLSCSKAAP